MYRNTQLNILLTVTLIITVQQPYFIHSGLLPAADYTMQSYDNCLEQEHAQTVFSKYQSNKNYSLFMFSSMLFAIWLH